MLRRAHDAELYEPLTPSLRSCSSHSCMSVSVLAASMTALPISVSYVDISVPLCLLSELPMMRLIGVRHLRSLAVNDSQFSLVPHVALVFPSFSIVVMTIIISHLGLQDPCQRWKHPTGTTREKKKGPDGPPFWSGALFSQPCLAAACSWLVASSLYRPMSAGPAPSE